LTKNKLVGENGVTIPDDIVLETERKYKQVYEILTGEKWQESQFEGQ